MGFSRIGGQGFSLAGGCLPAFSGFCFEICVFILLLLLFLSDMFGITTITITISCSGL